ncbi:MAG: c-type cytochrome [Planctomycetaceae bacterium]|nr:c-type cytochrome [Planctomycetaceae bacterium]
MIFRGFCLRVPFALLSSLFCLCFGLGSPVFAEEFPVPLGLDEIKVPSDNEMTAEKVALGKQLYFDKRLSNGDIVSCASCHDPAKGFSNGEAVAEGFNSLKGGRNSPTVINTAYQYFQFWDGRAGSLEEQALGPIQNPIEMNMKLDDVVARLNKIKGYRKQFQEVFGTDVTEEGIAKAIAAYERTILSGNAPYDQYKSGNKDALSPEAERGMKLFFGKAHCSACHAGPNFTDNGFHNIGVGMDAEKPDPGRFAISNLGGDTGSFKTPTLREIARTAPYMHDGSMATLEEVIEHYNKGGIDSPYLDEEIFPLKLTEQEQQDLITFLKEGLSSPDYPNHEAPELPQE